MVKVLNYTTKVYAVVECQWKCELLNMAEWICDMRLPKDWDDSQTECSIGFLHTCVCKPTSMAANDSITPTGQSSFGLWPLPFLTWELPQMYDWGLLKLFLKKIPTPCHNELTKNGSLPGRQQVQNPICGWSNPFSAGLYPHTYLLFKSQFSFFTVNVNFDQFWIILAAFIPISPAEILVVQIPNFLGVFIPKCVCAPSFFPTAVLWTPQSRLLTLQ